MQYSAALVPYVKYLSLIMTPTSVYMHMHFLVCNFSNPQRRTFFYFLTIYRSVFHISTSTQFFFLIVYGPFPPSKEYWKSCRDMMYAVNNIANNFFTISEVYLSINRLVAIVFWKHYNRFFTIRNLHILCCIPLFLFILLELMVFYDRSAHIFNSGYLNNMYLIYEAVCFPTASSLVLITIIILIKFKIEQHNNRNGRNFISRTQFLPFIFAVFQIFLSSVGFLTIFVEPSEDFYVETLFDLLPIIIKDFFEGLFQFLYLSRKNNVVVNGGGGGGGNLN